MRSASVSGRIGLLEERVRRLEWSGQEHDAPRVVRDSLQRRWRSRRRCDPYQEDRINILQAAIEALGNREIPAHHLDLSPEQRRIRVAGHGAELCSRCRQFRDHVAADVARCRR